MSAWSNSCWLCDGIEVLGGRGVFTVRLGFQQCTFVLRCDRRHHPKRIPESM